MSLSKDDLLPDEALAKLTLNRRAKYLAIKQKPEALTNDAINYICCRLGSDELYGIPFEVTKEVLINLPITPVPFTPRYIAGASNRHGNLIAIIDLKSYFSLPSDTNLKINNVILVEAEKMTLGLLVHSIDGIGSFQAESLNKPLTFAGFINAKYLLGLHNGTTAMINVPAILAEIRSELDK